MQQCALAVADHKGLIVNDLPHLTQNTKRVLAVITGVWDFDAVDGAYKREKMEYLAIILQNYRHACEHGYEVHVVLATYETANATLEATLPSPRSLFCDRLGRSVPVAVKRYPLQQIPNNTHGTMGTLSAMHRSLFAGKVNAGYDCFINQEDDLMVKAHHIDYFMRWSSNTEATKVYPAFETFEVPSLMFSRKELTSREAGLMFRGGIRTRVFSVNGTLWVEDLGNPPLMHMLTRSMLTSFVSLGYHDPSSPHYAPTEGVEFNPWYNIIWIKQFYTPALPLREFASSLLHHASNRYSESIMQTRKEEVFGLTPDEFEGILQRCTDGQVSSHRQRHAQRTRSSHENLKAPESAHFLDEPSACQSCLESNRECMIYVNMPPPQPIDWDFIWRYGRQKDLFVKTVCVTS